MIESVHFTNFKVLRDATLPLGQFTLIVGPNGSGKSTALQALHAAARGSSLPHRAYVSIGIPAETSVIEVVARWGDRYENALFKSTWSFEQKPRHVYHGPSAFADEIKREFSGLRVFSLSSSRIGQAVTLEPNSALDDQGGNLAGVLDRLRDQEPERFDALNEEFSRWLPEYDRILFDTPDKGQRAISLRIGGNGATIRAAELSQGTLLALAILTLAYQPGSNTIVCLEEPDRGIHPRLLRDVQDALYRLAYPQNHGEDRPAVQVIATTHSPYMLDLFRDHPEEIVIAQKNGMEAKFERLSDRADLDQILRDAHLGDLWYSGILGGVPVNS